MLSETIALTPSPVKTMLEKEPNAQLKPREVSNASLTCYAGFWLRFVANMIDLVLFGACTAALALIWVAPRDLLSLGMITFMVAIAWLGQTITEVWVKNSPGKQLLSLKTIAKDGTPLRTRAKFLRSMAKLVGTLPFGFGVFLAAFTPRNQGLHDLMLGTIVASQSKAVLPLVPSEEDHRDL